ncbi:hypothetical protein AB0I28_38180 [Phytomonospora sp. NPDC050363]|uniref:hypothetical protein n=1 Tax=Phytomonospora sp. NPDC050363 TaxID=3155642 RepID=UPI003403D47C
MWQLLALTFLAGVFAANATPHFVKGITRRRFPTPFGSGPLVNVLVGWAGFVIAGLLLVVARPQAHPRPAFAAAALGVLAMGVFHASIRTRGPIVAPPSASDGFRPPAQRRPVSGLASGEPARVVADADPL